MVIGCVPFANNCTWRMNLAEYMVLWVWTPLIGRPETGVGKNPRASVVLVYMLALELHKLDGPQVTGMLAHYSWVVGILVQSSLPRYSSEQ